uniref:Uncharacterized protein n=1 Tax=Populus trichocarpa TaxID=3694 RepID=A0A2K1XM14_POPTR
MFLLQLCLSFEDEDNELHPIYASLDISLFDCSSRKIEKWAIWKCPLCLRLIDGVHYGMCSLVFLVLCSYDNIMFSSPSHIITCSQFVAGFPAGCHRYETHRRLGAPTIRCKIRPLRHHLL